MNFVNMRLYHGKMGDLFERFRKHTIALFEKHGMKIIGFFSPVIGDQTNCLTYILAYENLAAREKSWNAFLADEEWKKVYKESNSNGQIVVKVENAIFSPTDFSPLQ